MIKLFRLLTLLYPEAFRREYGALMEQAFRDQLRDSASVPSLLLNTIVDLLKSAISLRWEENMQTVAAVVFAIAAALFLGRFELRSDDSGVVAALVLLFAFILGFWQPRYAWLMSFIGLSIPLAELTWGQPSLKKAALIALFVMTVSITGSVCGVLARNFVTRLRSN